MNDAACAGQWELFDSTDRADHREAVKLCKVCPMLSACVTQLRKAQQASPWGGPQGTWAGLLINNNGPATDRSRNRDSERIAAEEAAYSEEDCRAAKAAYMRGSRTEWAVAGNRTYERRRKHRLSAALSERYGDTPWWNGAA